MALDENSSKQIIKAKIPFFRKRIGLTQDEVADKMGIPRSTYAYYESNASKLSAEFLNRLAVVLKIEPEDLLPPKNSPTIILESPHSEYQNSNKNIDENMILMIYRKLNEEDKAKYLNQLIERYKELLALGEISEDLI